MENTGSGMLADKRLPAFIPHSVNLMDMDDRIMRAVHDLSTCKRGMRASPAPTRVWQGQGDSTNGFPPEYDQRTHGGLHRGSEMVQPPVQVLAGSGLPCGRNSLCCLIHPFNNGRAFRSHEFSANDVETRNGCGQRQGQRDWSSEAGEPCGG